MRRVFCYDRHDLIISVNCLFPFDHHHRRAFLPLSASILNAINPKMPPQAGLPKLTPDDGYPTVTSILQHETEEILLEYLPLSGKEAPFALRKKDHMQWLIRLLINGFPSRYAVQDASQPWLLFWILQSFSCLTVALDPGNKERYVSLDGHWGLCE